MKITTHLLGAVLLVGSAVQYQSPWLTDPAYGARRNAYGPGAHMDAAGRLYHDTPSNAWVFEPVQPNAYGLGTGQDTLGRAVVPDTTRGIIGQGIMGGQP